MKKTLVLFESKNGFTKKIAEEVSLILGNAKCVCLTELESHTKDYEVIVICVPFYSEKIESGTLEHLCKNADRLSQKKLIVLCTCRTKSKAVQYLQPLESIFGERIVYSTIIESEHFNEEKFVELVLELKMLRELRSEALEEKKLEQCVEDFIKGHNTCSLSTGYGRRVRATPIEYIYLNKALYVLSEGGEKFANILLNPNVSVGIFNDYKNMSQLGGMQLTGFAEIIEIGCDEYCSVLVLKNLKYEQITALPIALNMIKISIRKAEFLWSGFREFNCDSKQVLVLH
jgi:hypothetical protein